MICTHFSVLAVRQPALGDDLPPIRHGCKLERHFAGKKFRSLDKEDATVPNLKALSTPFSIIHFGTHGMLNANNGLYSYLAMSKHGENGTETDFLYSKDIFNLRLYATLVVLRACMSGLGRIHPGDDIIGLTRAFFYAGTPSILASLWEIDDKESRKLIDLFYAEWLRCGDKAQGLRQAQLQRIQPLRALRKETHPYHWAGFALFGNYRSFGKELRL